MSDVVIMSLICLNKFRIRSNSEFISNIIFQTTDVADFVETIWIDFIRVKDCGFTQEFPPFPGEGQPSVTTYVLLVYRRCRLPYRLNVSILNLMDFNVCNVKMSLAIDRSTQIGYNLALE